MYDYRKEFELAFGGYLFFNAEWVHQTHGGYYADLETDRAYMGFLAGIKFCTESSV